jgi:hypothetical protein
MGQLEDVQLHVVAPPFVRVGEKVRRGISDDGKLHELSGIAGSSWQESNLLLHHAVALSQMK